MAKEKVNDPQSQEEMIKAAQEAAVRAAIEQAQSMFGTIPGFEMPDMGDMQAEMMAQLKAAVPDLDQIQAQQAAMGTLGTLDAATLAEEGRQNMAYARQMMQEMEAGTLASKLQEADPTLRQFLEEVGSDWEISRAGDGKLNARQLRLLAFGAPLLVYNDEHVDTLDCEIDTDTLRTQLKDWWEVTDRDSTFEIVAWLLKEGHHAEADEALKLLHEKGLENLPETDDEPDEDDEGSKQADVRLIVKSMLENAYCTEKSVPKTAIAWDLVRIVNLGRWAYVCGYLAEDEMWEITQQAADTAAQHFTSWEAYGLSFVLGRGVWHGDPDDSETAHEIVSVLLEKEASPWKQIAWNNKQDN